jgi:hypothetical protein
VAIERAKNIIAAHIESLAATETPISHPIAERLVEVAV